jgi:hypothetical protein
MHEFEPILLKKIISSQEFFNKVMPIVEENHFSEIGTQRLFGLIKDHYRDYREIPTLTELVAKVKNVSDSEIRKEIIKSLVAVNDTEEVKNIEFMCDETVRWIKDEMYLEALRIGSDGLMKKDPELKEKATNMFFEIRDFSLDTEGSTKSLLAIDELEFEDYKWHCNSFIPIIEGKLIMVTGRGASGKGIAMFRTALQFLEENPTKKALLWNMEDNVNDIKIRLKALSKNGLIIPDDVKGRLQVKDTLKNIELSNLRHYFKDYDLVVVDPVSYLMDGDENDSQVVRPVMKLFQDICTEENKTIIMVHHEAKGTDGKGTKQARGSSAFFDNSRLSYSIRYEEGGEYHVDTVKNNYGKNRENFTIDPWFPPKSSVIPFSKPEKLDADVFNRTFY